MVAGLRQNREPLLGEVEQLHVLFTAIVYLHLLLFMFTAIVYLHLLLFMFTAIVYLHLLLFMFTFLIPAPGHIHYDYAQLIPLTTQDSRAPHKSHDQSHDLANFPTGCIPSLLSVLTLHVDHIIALCTHTCTAC